MNESKNEFLGRGRGSIGNRNDGAEGSSSSWRGRGRGRGGSNGNGGAGAEGSSSSWRGRGRGSNGNGGAGAEGSSSSWRGRGRGRGGSNGNGDSGTEGSSSSRSGRGHGNSNNWGRGNSNGANRNGNSGGNPNGFGAPNNPRSVKDLTDFLKQLRNAEPKRISKLVVDHSMLWNKCWSDHALLCDFDLKTLLVSLCKIPYSSSVEPPSITLCTSAMSIRLNSINQSPPAVTLEVVEDCVNLVTTLLQFEWNETAEEVKLQITNLFDIALRVLSAKDQDHRRTQIKILDRITDLEKPWSIKAKEIIEIENETATEMTWKTANVQWLLDQRLFLPSLLPRMNVPVSGKGNSDGVYKSTQDYMNTIIKIWTGLTFGEGHAVISPVCKARYGEKECGKVLWPCPSELQSFVCRGSKCSSLATYSCPDPRHKSGLCQQCFQRSSLQLLGSPGMFSSTHLYDAHVESCSIDCEVNLVGTVSRKPPPTQVHWKTTKRLQITNLVALVKVPVFGSALQKHFPIVWGQITAHNPSDQRNECREKQKVRVTVLEQLHETFIPGESIVIIDCFTFVPEFLPILKALNLQQDSPIPFMNGDLLNLNSTHKQPLKLCDDDSSDIKELSCDSSLDSLEKATELIIRESCLQPFLDIRQNTQLKTQLYNELLSLLVSSTLDDGQMKSFMRSMTNPVHCTQGPPGTGKSYIGVVIVKALVILRKLWIKIKPSVGAPPILVLSYKNHAIDEFLVDITKNNYLNLVRIGSGKDPRLDQYSERFIRNSDLQVNDARKKLSDCISLKQGVRPLIYELSKLESYAANPAEFISNNNEMYEIVQIFVKTIHKLDLISNSTDCSELQVVFNSDFIDGISLDMCLDILNNKKRPTNKLAEALFVGIQHLDNNMDIHEILLRWLHGSKPPPQCRFIHSNGQCKGICQSSVDYCIDHSCKNESDCKNPAPEGHFCISHTCDAEDCIFLKLENQIYCGDHACFKCLESEQPAALAEDEPPRNTCENHKLCVYRAQNESCNMVVVENTNYCDDHQSIQCKGITAKGKQCPSTFVMSKQNPYCKNHAKLAPAVVSNVEATNQCNALTKKKKQCKGKKIPNYDYCKDHLDSYQSNIKSHSIAEPDWDSEFTFEGPTNLNETIESEGERLNDQKIVDTKLEKCEIDLESIHDSDLEEEFFEVTDMMFDRDQQTDNIDEVEQPDHLKHLEEIYHLQEEESDESEVESEEGEEVIEIFVGAESHSYNPPQDYSWGLNIGERLEICQGVIRQASMVYGCFEKLLTKETARRRKVYNDEKIKAKARVYEGKEVIGGTIVGCISRLESIRSTNPFAIVVEEASEVLEPMLFACLTPSTVKLEMIGDHKQLAPSLMNKFEFEQINRVNVSMFERLIRAPAANKVASTILSVQRRMRTPISDLTRDFYTNTEIVDHPIVATRRIGEASGVGPGSVLSSSVGKGLIVSSIGPQIFFWSHSGKQTKSKVGMSKRNQNESEIVTDLAQFLNLSGIPKSSIAILTPYKGQLIDIKDLMNKRKMLSYNETDSYRLSTVDRFQGDESDIVIVSLVIDGKSKTPFVQLVNRLIVLLSRARIGMYIIGNLSYFEGKEIKHWKQTFEKLETLSPSSVLSELDYQGSRIGDELPVCCGLHRTDSEKLVKDSKDLKFDFCQIICDVKLNCGHSCNKVCHFPDLSHEKKCKVMINSPCDKHPEQLLCCDICARGKTLEESILLYKCKKQVCYTRLCGHEEKLECYFEELVQKGERTIPDCLEKAFYDYVQPGCLHSISSDCSTIERYTKNSSSVPKCTKEVEYVNVCGHSSNMTCTKKQSCQDGSIKHLCILPVTVNLPRCGHVQTVICREIQVLNDWTGKRNETFGIVSEGIHYGPKDYICSESTTFKRNCGHDMIVECEKAFEYSVNPPKCNKVDKVVSPICGHNVNVGCHDRQILSRYSRLGKAPVNEVDFDDCLKDFVAVPIQNSCKTKVTLNRGCGHKEIVECRDVQNLASSIGCLVPVKINNPLCNHLCEIDCRFAVSWKPWSDAFESSNLWKEYKDDNIVKEDWEVPSFPPKEFEKIVRQCNQKVTFVRSNHCHHQQVFECNEAFGYLWGGLKLPICKKLIDITLECGHEHVLQCNQEGANVVQCIETVPKNCWNFEICGQVLKGNCHKGGQTLCCSKLTTWECPSLLHSFEIQQCLKGVPESCPKCDNELISDYITRNGEIDQLNDFQDSLQGLLMTLEKHEFKEVGLENIDVFQRCQYESFENYSKLISEQDLFENRSLFKPTIVPVYSILQGKMKNASNFEPTLFIKGNTLSGMKLSEITTANFQKDSLRTLGKSFRILVGFGFILNAVVQPDDVPKGKQQRAWSESKQSRGFDGVQLKDEESFVFWHPYCVIATHLIEISHERMAQISSQFKFERPEILKETLVLLKPIESSPGEFYDLGNEDSSPTYMLAAMNNALLETKASGLTFSQAWSGLTFGIKEEFTKSLEKEFGRKLNFVSKATLKVPFSGIKYLEKKQKNSQTIVLLKSLEFHSLNLPEFEQYLLDYIGELKKSKTEAHPLLLVALARWYTLNGDKEKAVGILAPFKAAFPSQWLTKDELKDVIHDPKKVDRVLSLREKWVLLSQKEGIRSEAMEKLLKLTGLKRVKEFALNLFQTAISLAKMSPEDRKANPWSKNMVFMGNPGTGKTVVAGFIAQILFDSGIRKSKEIVKTTAQALKDGGTAGFKTLIDKARNGCLFIDEAYDLDPMADFKGKPICADLLTTAEDERESLTIILAGYQDDIEKKLFAYNPGFPSRFENVYFEDFDQEDLEEICLGMLKSRNISYDPQVPKLLAQRLSLKANTKGFGNARDVRKELDRAIEKSLSLPDFNGKARIDLIDIAGEDPSRNKKLQLLVEDLNQKIGWDPIKKAIAELISQSTKNYERQLKGQPPLPVFLNRLFLGNPGTGKTTCAEIYGKILKELKLLSQGNLVKKTAGDFIGEHIGSSQTKTKTILDSAKGNILVIDEAYNLDDSMFGKQVLDVLVEKVQGTIADDIAVILLGYEKPMLDMIRNQNPGLSRRFPKEFAFDFEDYNDDQLLQILIAECKKKEIQVASYEVYERIIQVISRQRSGPNFGNVGSLNLLLQTN